jgi:hypothetical protein
MARRSTARLYDLKTDPGQENVADKHPDIVKKLSEHYEAWWKESRPTASGEYWPSSRTR